MVEKHENFGDVLKELRVRSGLSQAELAAEIYQDEAEDARRQRIGRIERDKLLPPDGEINRIAYVLAAKLERDPREVRGLLFSQTDHREDVLAHIESLKIAIGVLLTHVSPEKEPEPFRVILEMQNTADMLTRLSGLVPEAFFWEVLNRYISFQGVGSQLIGAQQLLPMKTLLQEERDDFQRAASYFQRLQNRGADYSVLPKDFQPVDMMRSWINILSGADDALLATHFSGADFETKPWQDYHRANIRAARRGVKIVRYFIYKTSEELLRMEPYIEQQKRANIIVKKVKTADIDDNVLDIAKVRENVLGILSLDKPARIDFVHLDRQPAQRGLVEWYRKLLERSANTDPERGAHVGYGSGQPPKKHEPS